MRNKKNVLMTLNHNYGCFSGVGSGIAGNVFGLCVRWGLPALKPIDSTNFNLSTNDYR
jgi:hypothetical protein